MKQRDLTNSTTKTESVVRSYDQLLLQECCTTPRINARYNKTIITQWKEGNLHDGYILYTIYIYIYKTYTYMFIRCILRSKYLSKT